MKKYLFILILIIFIVPTLSFADTDCSSIDGSDLYGNFSYNTGNDWTYIGSISNSYDSNSIANEYGSYGSKYESDSIWNDYGDFGGKYSQYSPFNKYSSTPPILITPIGKWAYVSTNKNLQHVISPYIVEYCAEQSYSTSTHK